MTETTLNVSNKIVLPPELHSMKYRTNNIVNHVELQTLEKAFVKIPATSKDSNSITWNIPSISGGYMTRDLEFEIPLTWTASFKPTAPSFVAGASFEQNVGPDLAYGDNLVSGDTIFTLGLGSNVRPFLKEMNCLDQFPLSKIFRNRTYQFNNSSVTLKEDLTPAQIDAMVAQMNMDKMRNAGLEVFADANSHFNTYSEATGGLLLPQNYTSNGTTGLNITEDFAIWGPDGNPGSITSAGVLNNSVISAINKVLNISAFRVGKDEKEDTWFSKRNSARNIVSSSAVAPTIAGVTWGPSNIAGYGSNPVLYKSNLPNNRGPAYGTLSACAYYSTSVISIVFNTTVREQLVSQYFDHEYNFEEFAWNKLIPLSSMNMKFIFDRDYMNGALLKIGDNLSAYDSFAISSQVTLGNQSECYFISKQCKVPLALQPRESYKVLFYDQVKPQSAVAATRNPAGRKYSATMYYANLSQVGEYLMISMPIDRSAWITSLGETSTYQLPTVFNLPITDLQITFNSDSGLCTYDMDWFRLQQLTLQNLQNDEELKNLTVGKSEKAVGKFFPTVWDIDCTATISSGDNAMAVVDQIKEGLLNAGLTGQNYRTSYSGVSNSSFYILKLGSQLRLPDGYTPSQLVNHNITIKATCDLDSTLFKNVAGCINDNYALGVFESQIVASLDVVHFVKKVYSLSGSAMQNLYIHDIMLSSSEFIELRTAYESAFASEERTEEPFGADMMIGGAGIGRRIYNTFKAALPHIRTLAKPLVKPAASLAKTVAPGWSHPLIDVASNALTASGQTVRGGSAMDPHEVSAGRRGRKSGSSTNAKDWNNYLQSL